MSCCLSHLILLTFILGSSWANILSILSTFAPHFKYIVLLCHQLHLGVLSKHIANPSASHIYEYIQFCHSFYSQDNDVATLLLLGCYLSGSKPLMEKSYVGFHCLSALSHLFPLTIYFVIMFSSFFADYVTKSFLYWQFLFVIDFSHESEFCNKQWSFGRWYYCSSPVVYKKFFFLINQKWIVYFKMTPNCILCLFGKVSKLCMCFSVN